MEREAAPWSGVEATGDRHMADRPIRHPSDARPNRSGCLSAYGRNLEWRHDNGDSELTWQVFGGVGYRFDRVDAVLGRRPMEWRSDDSPVFDDVNLSGPFAGVKFLF